nr:Fe-S oxidoreductase [Bacteroidota bacterium]
MGVKNIIFAIIFLTSLTVFGFSIGRLIRYLKIGKPENRFDAIPRRIGMMLKIAFAQLKVFREPIPGIMHAFIFWGFLVLLTAILEAILEGLIPGLDLASLGTIYSVIAFFQELFAILVIIGVGIALYRRIILKPKRLDRSRHAQIDAITILCTILLIMIAMLGQFAAQSALGEPV